MLKKRMYGKLNSDKNPLPGSTRIREQSVEGLEIVYNASQCHCTFHHLSFSLLLLPVGYWQTLPSFFIDLLLAPYMFTWHLWSGKNIQDHCMYRLFENTELPSFLKLPNFQRPSHHVEIPSKSFSSLQPWIWASPWSQAGCVKRDPPLTPHAVGWWP